MEDSKLNDKNTLTKDNVQLAFRNIHNALNKSSLKGVFDLKESAQLCNDLTIFGQIVENISKSLP
jgi:hypothetical protein